MADISWTFSPDNPFLADWAGRLKTIFTDLQAVGAAKAGSDTDYVTGDTIKGTLDIAVTGTVAAGGSVEFGPTLPIGAVIVGGYIYVQTAFESATDAATMTLGLTGNVDIIQDEADAISHGTNPWDPGLKVMIPDDQAADSQLTAVTAGDRLVFAVDAGPAEAVTAGKLTVVAHYIVP
jgi:hypothetical protein